MVVDIDASSTGVCTMHAVDWEGYGIEQDFFLTLRRIFSARINGVFAVCFEAGVKVVPVETKGNR